VAGSLWSLDLSDRKGDFATNAQQYSVNKLGASFADFPPQFSLFFFHYILREYCLYIDMKISGQLVPKFLYSYTQLQRKYNMD
jgi:hypothetical protein